MVIDQIKTASDLISLLNVLHDQGVRSIRLEFEGSGDSGDYEGPYFHDSQDKDVEIENESEISDLIEDFMTGTMMDEVGDWYNNDGGYGHITLQVPSGDYNTEAHIRHTETYDDDYTGHAADKLDEE